MKCIWIPVAVAAGFLAGLHAQSSAGDVLLEADREFDRVTASSGAEGWASFFAEDGRMFRNTGEVVTGRDSIREMMEPLFAKKENSLRWKPEFAGIAASADLGYTSGTSLLRYMENGEPMERPGRYVTIWGKQGGGSWKVVLDIGNSGQPRKR
ncbi:MAG: DUF4440 domain-containing protein [Acidobacteriia bacterium]|nr:DUF4440 domain-containing protein [Terriglobia bacterium]